MPVEAHVVWNWPGTGEGLQLGVLLDVYSVMNSSYPAEGPGGVVLGKLGSDVGVMFVVNGIWIFVVVQD